MEEIDQNLPDRIYEVFSNKTVFLTGGTGYLGKVFVERILRLLDVKKIYLLVRIKRGQSPESRLEKLFTSPLFDKVRQERGDEVLLKCQVIPGDVQLDDLGISSKDRLILQKEVDFVIHSAATVKFDEPLKSAVAINVKGIQQAIKVAKKMEKLQIFVHVSTAYCHPEETVLYEKFYKTNLKPDEVIQMMEWLSEKQIKAMTREFLDGIPNTYTFTKSLGEELVSSEIDNLPIIVVRPSIVIPIWKEPIPGWTDNINGPTGLLLGACKGVIRTMPGNEHAQADFISVDGCIDLTLCIASYSVIHGRNGKIFNLTTSNEFKVTWDKLLYILKKIVVTSIPFDMVLWKPDGSMRKSKVFHLWALVVYQLIPAIIVDALAFCFGYKPFLWNIQKKILNASELLEYYTYNEWTFNNDNTLQIRSWMNKKEIDRYVVRFERLDLEEYLKNFVYCGRKYIFNEPDKNLPRARRIMRIMVWLDKICNMLIKVLLAYLFYKYIFLNFCSSN